MPTDNLYELTEAKELPETNYAAPVSEGDEIRADSFGDDENMDLHQTLTSISSIIWNRCISKSKTMNLLKK